MLLRADKALTILYLWKPVHLQLAAFGSPSVIGPLTFNVSLGINKQEQNLKTTTAFSKSGKLTNCLKDVERQF